jgi:hypothetical protein
MSPSVKKGRHEEWARFHQNLWYFDLTGNISLRISGIDAEFMAVPANCGTPTVSVCSIDVQSYEEGEAMTRQEMITLVERYFAGVDGEDFAAINSTLTEDCVFTVETHGVELIGVAQISGMFDRLWSRHAAVRHEGFVYVPAPEDDRIAVRFAVINTHDDETLVHKSNCNFFEVRGDRFSRVAVYMAGENTLEAKNQS